MFFLQCRLAVSAVLLFALSLATGELSISVRIARIGHSTRIGPARDGVLPVYRRPLCPVNEKGAPASLLLPYLSVLRFGVEFRYDNRRRGRSSCPFSWEFEQRVGWGW